MPKELKQVDPTLPTTIRLVWADPKSINRHPMNWRDKRPRPLTPEQEQALDAALARVRRQAVSGEGPCNDACD
jgi:hypothetical protein